MGSILRRPRWIMLSALVTVIVAAFVALGFWQLSRLDERRLSNAVLDSRLNRPPITLSQLTSAGVPFDDLDYTLVAIDGAFDPDGSVMVRNQTNDGEAGTHVVVPFLLDETSVADAVLVNVGWVPIDGVVDVPASPQSIVGFVRASQERPAFGRTEPDGILAVVNRVDIARLQLQVPYDLAPFWVQLVSPDDGSSPPIPVDPPVLDEGTHFAYAMQWFAFALISVVGYIALVRRESTRDGGGAKSYVVEDDDARTPTEAG